MQGASRNVGNTEHGTQGGFILIAVLWITLLLSIFALNAATKSRLQSVQAAFVQEMPVQNQILYSALSRGIHEYRKYEENKSLLEQKDELEAAAGKQLELWFPRYEPYVIEIEGIRVGIRILNTQGKLNINTVNASLLEEIVVFCGASRGAESTSVTNSILDWIDEDDLKRVGGAERDYYLSLPDPYLPKNNEIDDIRELLLVKGVSRDMFYGTEEHPGLTHFFSVHGGSERMDINSAAPETFAILGGVSQEVIQAVIEERRQKPFAKTAELGEFIPHGSFEQLNRYYHVAREARIKVQAFIIHQDKKPGRMITRIYGQGR